MNSVRQLYHNLDRMQAMPGFDSTTKAWQCFHVQIVVYQMTDCLARSSDRLNERFWCTGLSSRASGTWITLSGPSLFNEYARGVNCSYDTHITLLFSIPHVLREDQLNMNYTASVQTLQNAEPLTLLLFFIWAEWTWWPSAPRKCTSTIWRLDTTFQLASIPHSSLTHSCPSLCIKYSVLSSNLN